LSEKSVDLAANEIDISPTKALFVEILTKDILLGRAVLDLIDNSIDGARRLRPGPDADLTGLWIKIDVGVDHFSICDNCGGMDIETARHYAFRFGRPKGMTPTPGSVGQFGVGMKRALFKFGRRFKVASKTQTERFLLEVSVDEWEQDPEWKFKFSEVERDLNIPLETTGTEIEVTQLREPVATAFALGHFKTSLAQDIQAAQQHHIDRNLLIIFDKKTLIRSPWKLLQGAGIEPAAVDWTEATPDGAIVSIRLFAGVADSAPQEAGWYIICNGRLVVEADQSAVTGWSSVFETRSIPIPKYHNQFARFRGYLFFDCEDASALPWNTTKTGVDAESAIYQATLQKMIEAMRPIIDFLNKLDAEKDAESDDRPLSRALSEASAVRVRDVSRRGVFTQPTPRAPSGPPQTRISYSRPRDQVDSLKESLGVTTNKDVGEKTFDMIFRKHGAT
jgi:hypothetical protein